MTDFDAMYRQNPDPWGVRTSWYEQRKQALLLAALPQPRYRLALELGCGTGAATQALAPRCEAVWAVDLSATAVAACRARFAPSPHVRCEVMHLPSQWPLNEHGAADLLVVAELAYYFSDADLSDFLVRCLDTLGVGGDWVMCHYTDAFHDRCQDTEALHAAVDALTGLQRIVTHIDVKFRLDVWRKLPGTSA